jgi:hypothetical protein
MIHLVLGVTFLSFNTSPNGLVRHTDSLPLSACLVAQDWCTMSYVNDVRIARWKES